jgi:hypothetical protein
MQIVYHLGAHCTDDGALLRVLLRNRAVLSPQGIAVPSPDRYPDLLRAAAAAFAGRPTESGADEALLDALLPEADDDAAARIVLSFEGFLAFPRDAVAEGRLYPAAAKRVQGLAGLFPGSQVEFHLAIRNPATWVPALSARRKAKGQDGLPDGFDASALRWSDLVQRIRTALPDAPLTVWCDEDTPVIWHSVLRGLAGQDERTELAHALALAASLMTDEGAKRMAGWFASAKPATDAERRKAIRAFLDKFALPEKLEVEVDFPGWTADTVAALSLAYDEDCSRIAAIEGVRFVQD